MLVGVPSCWLVCDESHAVVVDTCSILASGWHWMMPKENQHIVVHNLEQRDDTCLLRSIPFQISNKSDNIIGKLDTRENNGFNVISQGLVRCCRSAQFNRKSHLAIDIVLNDANSNFCAVLIELKREGCAKLRASIAVYGSYAH